MIKQFTEVPETFKIQIQVPQQVPHETIDSHLQKTQIELKAPE